ncbi:SPOR domain-containing protein [Hydrogenophaga sp.]|uniref:SPOR domain-containing protein n=2 Tax=Hydrogenophaga sp. TaxID=1904254 RepID=UPI0026236A0D|nr:SPOR domain-containing protein [Hydrogenophaga sp.]
MVPTRMFKSRSGSQGNPSTPPPQSIDAVRRRARHRLIGASVLVLLGVVGFPLLFDTQPRPISVDIPIEIPAKSTPAPAVKPPSTAAAPAAAPPTAKPPAPSVEARETLSAREEVVEAAAPPKSTAEPAKPASAPADAERARALLEGKTATAPATAAAATPATAVAERLVVQVGAFSEESGARSVRQKLEAAGLKTYTHVAETSEGRRIRVRLGPYNNRAEADKAAARVKALGLPAAVLTL